MIRYLQVVQGKPITLMTTSAAVKKGAPAAKDLTDDTVAHEADGLGIYLIDISPTYEGIHAIVTPTDDAFEDASIGATVPVIPTMPGERYATSEITAADLAQGDPLKAVAGKFVKATAGSYAWVYGGTYADPTGLAMHIIERVNIATIA